MKRISEKSDHTVHYKDKKKRKKLENEKITS